jgi:hypothetical protein
MSSISNVLNVEENPFEAAAPKEAPKQSDPAMVEHAYQKLLSKVRLKISLRS